MTTAGLPPGAPCTDDADECRSGRVLPPRPTTHRACAPPAAASPRSLATRSQPFRRAVCRSGTLRRRPSSRWAQDHGHVVTLGLVQPPDCFVVHRLGMYLDHVTGPRIPRDPRQQGRPRQVRQNKGRRPERTSVASLMSQRPFHRRLHCTPHPVGREHSPATLRTQELEMVGTSHQHPWRGLTPCGRHSALPDDTPSARRTSSMSRLK